MPRAMWHLWEELNDEAPTYLVGGAVRDLLRQALPHDWDLATKLPPDQVQRLATQWGYRVIPTGVAFGTVTVLTDDGPVEVTTFRKDGRYVDGRHPQTVQFAETLEEDLSRRDFTINAMALTPDGGLIDPWGGLEDLQASLLRAVGVPDERFQEDPLRMWRAVRQVGQLGVQLTEPVRQAILRYRNLVQFVSVERQRDELMKGLGNPNVEGFLRAATHDTGLLFVLWPEFLAAQGFDQYNRWHTKDVLEHLIATAVTGSPPVLRLTGLLHDIAKPACFWRGPDGQGHFYGHDTLGARYAEAMLRRLAFDKATVHYVMHLIAQHMFPWDEAGTKALRRMVREQGEATVQDLLELRRMDVIGSGRCWANEAEVRAKVSRLLEEVPEEHRRLAISGHAVMEIWGIPPGPKVGEILQHAQALVDEDPEWNQRDRLVERLRVWREQVETAEATTGRIGKEARDVPDVPASDRA